MKLSWSILPAMLAGAALLFAVGCRGATTDVVPETIAMTLTPQLSQPTTTVAPIVPTKETESTITATALPLPSPSATLTLAPLPTNTSIPTQITPVNEQHSDPVVLFYAADGHLYWADVAGHTRGQLTTKPEKNEEGYFYRFPQISPDGRWLALNGGWGGSALLDLVEGVEEGIGRGRAMRFPTWSPDSQRFAYLGQNDKLCLYEIATQSEACPFQATSQLLIARWSPDGAHIAIATVDPSDSADCCTGQVWLMNTINYEAEIVGSYYVTLEPARDSILTWLPGGSGLLIRSETSAVPSTLFFLEDRSTVPFAERVASMSPNGRYFLSESGRIRDINGRELYTIPTNTGDTACSNENLQLASWAWSSDGERLAYVTTCQTSDTNNEMNWIQVIDAATGESFWQQTIPAELSLRMWTPDGNHLLLSREVSPNMKDISIWRLASDGLDIPEMIIEQGLFLDIIP